MTHPTPNKPIMPIETIMPNKPIMPNEPIMPIMPIMPTTYSITPFFSPPLEGVGGGFSFIFFFHIHSPWPPATGRHGYFRFDNSIFM